MVSQLFVNIVASSMTASLAIIVGAVFFKTSKGGVKTPFLLGKKKVNIVFAFFAFIISVYIVSWFSQWLEPKIKNIIMRNQTNLIIGIVIPVLVLFLVFFWLFYKQK